MTEFSGLCLGGPIGGEIRTSDRPYWNVLFQKFESMIDWRSVAMEPVNYITYAEYRHYHFYIYNKPWSFWYYVDPEKPHMKMTPEKILELLMADYRPLRRKRFGRDVVLVDGVENILQPMS